MPARFRADLVLLPNPAIIARGFFIAAERIQDMEEPMRRAAQVVSESIRENFEAQGRPTRWEPLKESTQRKKAQAGLDPRILRASGDLYAGVTSMDAWRIERAGQEWVADMYDPTDYGWRHLETHRFMPIRDWAFVPDEELQEIEDVFYEWIDEILEQVA